MSDRIETPESQGASAARDAMRDAYIKAKVQEALATRDAEIERLRLVVDAADAHIQARWHAVGTSSARMADRLSGDDITAAAKAECEAFRHLCTALTQWKEAQS